MNLKNINPKLVAAAILGTIPGAILAESASRKKKKAWANAQSMLSKNKVDLKKSIQNYPEIIPITSNADITASALPEHEKRQLKKVINIAKKNAFFVESSKPSIIASPLINKYMLGHEIGHYKDYKEHRNILQRIFENRERMAWKSSPFAQEPESKKLEQSALSTYHQQKMKELGLGLMGVGSVVSPFIASRFIK